MGEEQATEEEIHLVLEITPVTTPFLVMTNKSIAGYASVAIDVLVSNSYLVIDRALVKKRRKNITQRKKG